MIIGSDFMNLSQQLGEKVSGKIFACDFKDTARKRAEDFTRNRAMVFEELILHILTSLRICEIITWTSYAGIIL